MQKVFLTMLLFAINHNLVVAQNIDIGTATPNANAIPDIKAVNMSLPVPGVALQSYIEVSTITASAAALMVYYPTLFIAVK